MDWSALQTRTNAAALAVFGDATVVLNGRTVTGDFHAPGDTVFLDGVSAAATKPQVVVLDADVPAAPVGVTCVIGFTTWVVADAQPDGAGMTVLYLEHPL